MTPEKLRELALAQMANVVEARKIADGPARVQLDIEGATEISDALNFAAGEIERLRTLAQEGWETARQAFEGEGVSAPDRVVEALEEFLPDFSGIDFEATS